MPGGTKTPNRYIKSELKSHRILWEAERPNRWPYYKILRESNLREFYPEINPYVEAYKMRDNMWALFSESMDGAGDYWMYLINGPEKAMLIDTGFGVGDLKGLCRKLIGDDDKELIVANTHHHYDHAYGNAQFDRCYCYVDEEFSMRRTINPHIWDYLFDENGNNIYTEFDKEDIITFKEYELITVPAGYNFDLGDGYEVELIPLRAHTAGQCGYLDKHNKVLITGDIGGVGKFDVGDPCADNCTIETLWRDLQYIVDRMDEYEGVFPGHGMLDCTNVCMKYELDACDRIMEDPKNADAIKTINRNGVEQKQYSMNILYGSNVKYDLSNVYRRTPYRR